jgi:hypothetical protein
MHKAVIDEKWRGWKHGHSTQRFYVFMKTSPEQVPYPHRTVHVFKRPHQGNDVYT